MDFESSVGAYYLAMMLTVGVPRGSQGDGVAQEVRFQRLWEGEPLDDIIVVLQLASGEGKLALQVKRDLVFSKQDANFDQVLMACWGTFTASQFVSDVDRIGVAVGLYNKTIDEHYQTVLVWARNSTSASDFLSRTSTRGLSSSQQRDFVELIRTKLSGYQKSVLSDEDLWRFLRSMVILHFDFQEEGSRDYAHTVSLLRYLVPAEDRDKVGSLFSALLEIAAERKRTAGSVTKDQLIAHLGHAGFHLQAQPDCRADLARLAEHGKYVMNEIKTDIGGLSLSRSELVSEALNAVERSSIVELVGPPGTGKSVILKALVQRLQGEAPVMVLAGDRITGSGWDAFASDLRLGQSLRQILFALSGGRSTCIFIDGVDKVVESGARKVVNDLLSAIIDLRHESGVSPPFRFIITARDENLAEIHSWLTWRLPEQPASMMIPELTAQELDTIVQHTPRLRPLLAMKHLQRIVRNPFMLSILEDQRMLPNSTPLPPVATEVEVVDTWWERVVGVGIHGTARREALLEIGKRFVQSRWRQVTVQALDSTVVDSLRTDQIVVREPARDVYRFRHDLFADWVLFRVLDSLGDGLPKYLQQLDHPYGLYRPLQLLGASRLERSADSAEWLRLASQFTEGNDVLPRWRQAILTSPLTSVRGSELLRRVEPFFLSKDATHLLELLVAVRTVEVSPDFSLLAVLSNDKLPIEEMLPILLSEPLPRLSTWMLLIDWIVQIADRLPEHVKPEVAQILCLWQKKTPTNIKYRKEVGELALKWLTDVKDRWDDDKA